DRGLRNKKQQPARDLDQTYQNAKPYGKAPGGKSSRPAARIRELGPSSVHKHDCQKQAEQPEQNKSDVLSQFFSSEKPWVGIASSVQALGGDAVIAADRLRTPARWKR